MAFSGDWQMASTFPTMGTLDKLLKHKQAKTLRVDLAKVGQWDTTLVALLYRLHRECEHAKMECAWTGVPEGIARLLELAAVRPVQSHHTKERRSDFFWRVGARAIEGKAAALRVCGFIGELVLSFGRLIKHDAYFRKSDFIEALADCGPRALPIITLISFLVGLILAFVGSMQLQEFGAQIFVANLVGMGMAREMGAMMTGIIMAGRTSSSYAARIGTMQVNEEVDALRTTGIIPMDFLTLPRILALMIMVPLLCVYSDAIGILGGMAIGILMLDLGPMAYWHQTINAISLNDFWSGLIKSVVFAQVIGIAGCYHGLRCGRSSEAVGKVTTVAVVSAIVFIIITDSILTVVYDVIDF